MTDERYYKLAELEKILSVSRETLWRWIRTHRLRAVKLGPNPKQRTAWRVSESALAELQHSRVAQPRK
jgi:excisionase family DNA binding protein